MSYKTIATVLTDPEAIGPTLDSAVEAARAHDAHLEVLALGVDRTQAGYYYAGASAVLLEQSINRAQETANAVAGAVKKRLTGCDIRWGCEIDVTQLADLSRRVAGRMRFCDLAILPKPYGSGRGSELEAAVESSLFEGQVPTMVVPDGAIVAAKPRRVVIGWNETPEAMRAVRAALPLLCEADKVHVVIVDPPSHGASRSDPGGMVSQFLARHGARAEIDVLSKTLPRVSDVLMRHALDLDADLIVTGAYGHSRFREAVFGGATRHLLEDATLPVLMAH